MTSPVRIWRRQKENRLLLGKTGKVLTWTHIQVPPDRFRAYAPYVVALVELSGGKRVVGQVVDTGDMRLHIGSRVVVTLRKTGTTAEDGVIAYGLKFKLLS